MPNIEELISTTSRKTANGPLKNSKWNLDFQIRFRLRIWSTITLEKSNAPMHFGSYRRNRYRLLLNSFLKKKRSRATRYPNVFFKKKWPNTREQAISLAKRHYSCNKTLLTKTYGQIDRHFDENWKRWLQTKRNQIRTLQNRNRMDRSKTLPERYQTFTRKIIQSQRTEKTGERKRTKISSLGAVECLSKYIWKPLSTNRYFRQLLKKNNE